MLIAVLLLIDKKRIKNKSASNVSAREVGSRHEKKEYKQRFAQAIPNQSHYFFFFFFFHSPNATMKIFV